MDEPRTRTDRRRRRREDDPSSGPVTLDGPGAEALMEVLTGFLADAAREVHARRAANQDATAQEQWLAECRRTHRKVQRTGTVEPEFLSAHLPGFRRLARYSLRSPAEASPTRKNRAENT